MLCVKIDSISITVSNVSFFHVLRTGRMSDPGRSKAEVSVSYDLALEATYHHCASSFWLFRSTLSHREKPLQEPECTGVDVGSWLPPSVLCHLMNRVFPFAEHT